MKSCGIRRNEDFKNGQSGISIRACFNVRVGYPVGGRGKKVAGMKRLADGNISWVSIVFYIKPL